MKKIKYGKDEIIFEEKLDNGLKVYMYPTKKSKNFYVTVSTHFGAEVMKYKKGDKTYEITKGSAHFLEHRVMDFTKNIDAMNKINELGSIVNAYTTYNGTNYNIFGNEDILLNMKLLFDRVFFANIKEEDVENERGIILEEYYMCASNPYYILETKTFSNLFNKSFIKYPVIGTVKGIETVKTSELRRLYKDFYRLDNMFVVVTGNFDKEEVLTFIKDYTKNIKRKNENIKIIKPKENLSVGVPYEELKININEEKVCIAYKTDMPKKVNKIVYRVALDFAVNDMFGKTGEAYEELVKNKIERYSFGVEEVDDLNIIYFKASTDKIEEFIKIVEKYLKKLKFSKESLERKKRGFLKPFILAFEDIMGVEDMITSDLLYYKKLKNKRDEVINNISLVEANNAVTNLNLSNRSILIMKNN